jgi:hypothetical protein
MFPETGYIAVRYLCALAPMGRTFFNSASKKAGFQVRAVDAVKLSSGTTIEQASLLIPDNDRHKHW